MQWDQSDRFLKNWVKEIYNGKEIYHFTDKFSNATTIKWFQDGYEFYLMPSNLPGNFRDYYQYCEAVKVPLPQ